MPVMIMLTVVTVLVATAASASMDLRAMGSTVQVCVHSCQSMRKYFLDYVDIPRCQ